MANQRSKFYHYLKGHGLEIGALNHPTPLPPTTKVTYSDILTPEQIDELYPGATHPDILSNSEEFPEVEDNSFDFIIANHVLEHLSDPIGAILEWHRILRDQGIIFLTIPDKRFTFDSPRTRTPLKHLVEDHLSNEPPELKNLLHLKEWATHVEGLETESEQWKEWVGRQVASGYSVHNHVWISEDIMELFWYICSAKSTRFKLLEFVDTPHGSNEFILVLRTEKNSSRRRSSSLEWLLKFSFLRLKGLLSSNIAALPLRLLKRATRHVMRTALCCMASLRQLASRDITHPKIGMSLRLNLNEEDIVALPRFISTISQTPRRALASLPLPASLGTHQCELRPLADVQQKAAARFNAVGPDPQLTVLSSLNRFPAGPVIVSFRWEGVPASEPRLYWDVGRGMSEEQSAPLVAACKGFSQTLTWLPEGIDFLRLDPCENEGEFYISEMRIDELSFFSSNFVSALISNSTLLDTSYNHQNRIRHTYGRSLENYAKWVLENELSVSDEDLLKEYAKSLADSGPCISILMPVYNPTLEYLQAAIQSVLNQSYYNWELSIVDDGSAKDELREFLCNLENSDPRIHISVLDENSGIAVATNKALQLASGEFVGFLDQDDLLHRNALYFVAKALDDNPQACLVYSDEDKISTTGTASFENGSNHTLEALRFDPHFKPDWSPELLLSCNYICHFAVMRKDILKQLGGLRTGFEGAQDWDLLLRYTEQIKDNQVIHVPKILYHWRTVEGSTADRIDAKPNIIQHSLVAVNDALSRRKVCGRARIDCKKQVVRINLNHSSPLTSIIITTRDTPELLNNCVRNVIERTQYSNVEFVIVDNGTTDQNALSILEELARDSRVRLVQSPDPFNYSALNNLGARNSSGSFLCFLNNDVSVRNPSWLSEMIGIGSQRKVGIVGAKLFYPDGRLQHAGVVLGVGGVADHAFYQQPGDTRGYRDRAIVLGNWAAVTGACMLIRRSVFEQVGGFDEKALPITFNDVDLCLKVRSKGYRVVYNPHAELYHLESASRDSQERGEGYSRFLNESHCFRTRWKNLIEDDPYYNPNFSLTDGNFSLAAQARSGRL